MHPKAEVNPAPESKMPSVQSTELRGVCVGENRFIPIARWKQQVKALTFIDLTTANDTILRRGPHCADAGKQADEFLDSAANLHRASVELVSEVAIRRHIGKRSSQSLCSSFETGSRHKQRYAGDR